MAYLAQSYNVFSTLRQLVIDELLWPMPQFGAGTSPLDTLSDADCTYYGLPSGSPCVLFYPKGMKTDYKYQCHITPPHPQLHIRRSYGAPQINGGKVWVEGTYGVALMYHATLNEQQVLQDLFNHGDALGYLLEKHTDVDGVATGFASKVTDNGPVPSGFFIDERIGREWYGWGFNWWTRQEYNIEGGYQP